MSMEVNRVLGEVHKAEDFVMPRRPLTRELSSAPTSVSQAAAASNQTADLSAVVAELEGVSQIFDRRLQFTVNQDLGQVVVKVIDKTTDTVIKEIPPAELQRAHSRIREAIGLFVDEQI